MKIPLSTHPETNTQLLLRSLRLYKHVFLRVFLYALAIAIIAFIPRIITLISNRPLPIDLTQSTLGNLWLILINIGALLFFTALLWRIRCVITDQHESVKTDIMLALKKLPYILVASIIPALLIILINLIFSLLIFSILKNQTSLLNIDLTRRILLGVMFILQVTIVFYIFFAFYFYLPIIVIENSKIMDSLQKSAAIVWRNWGRTLFVQITPWICFVLVLIFIQATTPLKVHIYFLDAIVLPGFLPTYVTILIFACFIPWIACLLLLQMRDLELRKVQETSAILPG